MTKQTKQKPNNRAKAKNLIGQLAKGENKTLIQKVAHILNHFPKSRDSDINLGIHLIKTFYPEYIGENEKINVTDFYQIPRFYDMQRLRAKIQNDYKLFLATPEVQKFRKGRAVKERQNYLAHSPDYKSVQIYTDESGKSEKFLILGGIWEYNTSEYLTLLFKIRKWREEENKINHIFHFNEISNDEKKNLALEFSKKFLSASDFCSFIALIVDNSGVPAKKRNSSVYEGFNQLIVKGIEKELKSNRISVPLMLQINKEKDNDSDLLELSKMTSSLNDQLSAIYRNKEIIVQDVLNPQSKENQFVQMADLFTSVIGRWINKEQPSMNKNAKEQFAYEFGKIFGFHLDEKNKIRCEKDFCKLLYLDELIYGE